MNTTFDEFELKDIVQGTKRLPSSFLINLPRDPRDGFQATVYFFLVSLSGIFDDISGNPFELAGAVRDRLNLAEIDLSGLPSRMFCRANGNEFALSVRPISGGRISFHSNNNLMESR